MFSAKSKFLNFIRINCGNPWNQTTQRALEQLGRMVRSLDQ
jgi:DNA-binding transcriptional MocR family regulator